MGHIQADAGVN